MKLATLIAISAVASILTQTSVFAQEAPVPDVAPATPAESVTTQEKSAEKSSGTPTETAPAPEKSAEKSAGTPAETPVREKKYSVGPAIEFGGGGVSFGITGKYTLSEQFSVRPLILLGYKPSVTGSNINTGLTVAGLSGALSSTQLDTIAGSIGSGFAVGSSITYDFKSADRTFVGYVGPRLLIAAASGNGSIVSGGSVLPFKVDAQESTIGLTAGADFAITPELTAGVNATYNFYRSLSIGKLDTINAGTTSGNFGINVTYNF
jgi:opacity protein-like surface antigen